jgi:hypothetical protein
MPHLKVTTEEQDYIGIMTLCIMEAIERDTTTGATDTAHTVACMVAEIYANGRITGQRLATMPSRS